MRASSGPHTLGAESTPLPPHQAPSPPRLGPTLRGEGLWVPHSQAPCAAPMDTPLPPSPGHGQSASSWNYKLELPLGIRSKKRRQRGVQSPVGGQYFQGLKLRNGRRKCTGKGVKGLKQHKSESSGSERQEPENSARTQSRAQQGRVRGDTAQGQERRGPNYGITRSR